MSNKRNLWKRAAALAAVLLAAGGIASCASPIIIHEGEEPGTSGSEAPSSAVTEPVTEEPASSGGEQTDEDGRKEPVNPDAGEDTNKAAAAYLASLRRADYGGTFLKIAATEGITPLYDGETGSPIVSSLLSSWRGERIRAVEEKYNVTFGVTLYDSNTLYREAQKGKDAELAFVADYFLLPPESLGTYVAEDLLLNLRTLPFTDFTQPYFNQRAMKQTSAGYGIWAAVGNFTSFPENDWCIFCNRDLLSKLGLPSPYTALESGNWTWDLFFENAALAATLEDISGSNAWLIAQKDWEPMLLASTGLHMVSTGLDVTPEVSPNTARIQKLVDCMFDHFVYGEAVSLGDDTAEDRFASGRMLYYAGTVSHAFEWADVRANWCLLPLPKISEEQKSYYTYTGGAAVLGVLSGNKTLEMTGTLL